MRLPGAVGVPEGAVYLSLSACSFAEPAIASSHCACGWPQINTASWCVCLGVPMPQHIGIVACSAEGAALCYRTICVEGAQLLGPHAHPEVSMHTPSLADYVV